MVFRSKLNHYQALAGDRFQRRLKRGVGRTTWKEETTRNQGGRLRRQLRTQAGELTPLVRISMAQYPQPKEDRHDAVS